MDKARPFEYVYRLPANSIEELVYGEAVYDRQVHLNETWRSYAIRKGRSHEADDEHVKWITRTWDDEELSRAEQRCVLREAIADGERQIAAREELARRVQQNSANVVQHVMAFEEALASRRLPCRHGLYVDFDDLQQHNFVGEQKLVLEAEQKLRLFAENCEDATFVGLGLIGECHRMYCCMKLNERLRKEEEERQRIAEEQQRAIEEEREREEMRQRELQEAERLHKEALEQAKILERKKREEARRAKVMTERERAKQHQGSVGCIAPEECPQHFSAIDGVPPVIGALQSPSEAVIVSETGRRRIVYAQPEGGSIVDLIKNVSTILSGAGDTSYVMNIDKVLMRSTVVCENGYFLGESINHENDCLLGKEVAAGEALSVFCQRLHSAVVASFEDYCRSIILDPIGNVDMHHHCFLLDVSTSRRDGSVICLPLFVSGFSCVPCVFAVSREGADGFQQEEVVEAAKVVWDLTTMIDLHLKKERRTELCQQCVDWLAAVTGCDNCYASLRDGESDLMMYVAASPSHKFMIGKTHSLAEECNGNGISFSACSAATCSGEPVVVSIEDVSDYINIPFENQRVRMFLDGEKGGSLLLGTITGKKNENECTSLGVVFMDYVGTKRKFTESEEQLLKTAVQLLANLLLNGTGNLTLGRPLKIEEEIEGLGASPVAFLKSLWNHALDNLSRITTGQLAELSNYLHPPSIVPLVVQATLIVALGVKPSKVEKWEDARERVTKKLLDKMSTFDPTDKERRKGAFFARSGKILKGYGTKDVLEKGSYPTKCFFSWVFTAILMRKYAEKLRKGSRKAGMVTIFSNHGSSVAALGESDENENGDDESVVGYDEVESGSDEA